MLSGQVRLELDGKTTVDSRNLGRCQDDEEVQNDEEVEKINDPASATGIRFFCRVSARCSARTL